MKMRLMMALIVLLASIQFINVNAGKPKPTPYPDIDVEIQSYPPPAPPFEFPDSDDPVLGVPYAWGYFLGRWWVSYDDVMPQPGLTGAVCILKPSFEVCYNLVFHHYDATRGRSWYGSHPIDCRSGTWLIYYAVLQNMYADIRQPNAYPIRCVHLPGIRRG